MTRSADRVLLVAPSPPPYGGMALQAQLLKKLLRNDGVPVSLVPSNLPLPGLLRLAEPIPGVRTLLRFVVLCAKLWTETGRADIVHVLAASWVYFFAVVFPAVLIGRIRGRRVILNYRGGEAREFFASWGWAAGCVMKLANTVTAPSEFLAQIIRHRFCVPVRIVSNILDTSAFHFRFREIFKPRLLVTRHLEKIYDIESVLRAFHVVQRMYPEASLLIAGTGSEKVHLLEIVAELESKNVSFLGHVPQKDLPAIYQQCDIYVNASRVDNFPGALLEAAAAGLVIVSTRAGGIPFIFEHGKTALLVEPGDWQGLAAEATTALERPAFARQLAASARTVAEACEWKEACKSLYEAYDLQRREHSKEMTASQ